MNVLVVVAHADDEVLGCGGTIAKHIDNGDRVYVAILADGVGSREGTLITNQLKERNKAADNASKVLGTEVPILLSLPDNQLDSIPLLEVVKEVEKIINEVHPETIYTHNSADLNVDHRVAYQAVMTACRPQKGMCVRNILSFEVPSSTEWSNNGTGVTFEPNYFVDISHYLEKKITALKCYDGEMRPFPHSRSYEALEYLAKWRGATVGMNAAEAFSVQRIMVGN